MKKILVLVENYPSSINIYAMSFVHSRNIEYLKLGIDVHVLNFSASENYIFEGITVYNKKNFKQNSLDDYDCIVSHAPNIRHHLSFLFLKMHRIKKLVFIFHGHETLKINKYYPSPYLWVSKQSTIKKYSQNLYDYFKLFCLRFFIKKHINNLQLIFVSKWMKKHSLSCLNLNIEKNTHIINNSSNIIFFEKSFDIKSNKKGDFITIRPLDGSKYSVDLVVALAKNNPNYTFTIYGKGSFFKYNKKPENIIHIETFIHQKDIPDILNQYKAAVMPTRLDAQGVMMCEMATYGIPMITSDLPICKEMLGDFNSCLFINNTEFSTYKIDLDFINQTNKVTKKNTKFCPTLLAKEELYIFFKS
ncbi:glycosyltransferase family 4 protein [Photorhabdus sp. RW14-46]|uniref:glycosyltransferase family 4 protein n=1 Tax=Photorhabdus sp. RW14-46 TaxID=2100168 RepID=UPI0013F3A539|nr:glycosyltransferase family 4 protein [Photorhabdus sp. RW14-46]NHB63676.1 hypothetical protein [Photorhabdus sp. RW14-46]